MKPATTEPDAVIARWIDGRLDDEGLASALEDRDDALCALLRAAVTERATLTPLEAAQAWERLSNSLPPREASLPFRVPWWLKAAASLAAAVSALLALTPRPEPPRTGQYVLLREVSFESADRNRTVSFKLQLYRTTEAEDARTPQR